MSGTVGDNTARASGVIASAGGGKILQVQSYSTDARPSQASGSIFVDISSFLVTLTPTATDSRIWINVSIGLFGGDTTRCAIFAVERAISGGATVICPPHGVASSNRLGGHSRGFSSSSNHGNVPSFSILDTTHNTTSEITYQLQWCCQATSYINRSYDDSNYATYGSRTVSGITAWEIGA